MAVVLIPALSPDERLVELARQLLAGGSSQLVVVDDGSDAASAGVFAELAVTPGCVVLHHDENLGKGAALKTGLRYCLANYPQMAGVVTADCDGQHTAADIERIAGELKLHPNDLILGVRDLTGAAIPAKSRFGNWLTRRLFRFFTGLDVTDTQTGLRGLPASKLPDLIALKGDRYEYELNTLLACKPLGITIRQCDIDTIYLNQNAGTHFNPLLDSIRVYSVFLQFVASSLTSFVVDYGCFLIAVAVFKRLMPATAAVFWAGVVSRVVSSAINYLLNRLAVFHSRSNLSGLKYYALASGQMLVSASLVALLHLAFGGGAPIFKILVDSSLFFLSFTIQRKWVFAAQGDVSHDAG